MLTILLLTAQSVALPPAPKLKLRMEAPPVVRDAGCYPSGLKVYAIHRPGTGMASVTAILPGGRTLDPAGQGGSTHLLEHLFFRSKGEADVPLLERSYGLEVEAQTRADVLLFQLAGASTDAEALLSLQSQVFSAPLAGVTEAEFSAERDIVRAEAWVRGAHSDRAAMRSLDHTLFPDDHPLRNTLADPAELDAITLEGLRALAGKALSPAGASLYIEADLPPRDVLDMADKVLPQAAKSGTGVPCGDDARPRVPGSVGSSSVQMLSGPRWRAVMYLGWTIPPQRGTGEAVLDLMEHALIRLIRHRIAHVPGLRQWSQHANVSCFHTVNGQAGSEICAVDLPPEADPVLVAKTIKAGLGDLSTMDINADLVTAARLARTRWLRHEDDQRADAVAQRALHTHYTGSPDLLRERLLGLTHTSGADIQRFAATFITADRMGAVHVGPGDGPVLQNQRISGKAMLTAPRADPWTPASTPADLTTRTLPNGVQAWHLNAGIAGSASVELVLQGGDMREPVPGANAVLDYMAVYAFPYGTGFWELETEVGVRAMHQYSNWANTFTTDGPVGNLDAQLWTVRLLAESQQFDLSERQSVLDQQIEPTFRAISGLPWVLAPALAQERLFGDHTASQGWWDRNLAARSVREEVVRKWQLSMRQPANATLVVIGPTQAATLDPLVDKYIGKWKGRGKPVPIQGPPAPAPPKQRFVMSLEQPAVLSTLDVACRVPGYTAEHIAALLVLEEAAREAMWQSLRAEGGSYAPGAKIEPMTDHVALLRLTTELGPRDAGQAAVATLAVLKELSLGEHEEFIDAAKRSAQGRYSRRFTSAESARGVLRSAATWGWSAEQVRDLPAHMEGVDAATIADLLTDCVDHEAVTLVGPSAAAVLTEAGLPPYAMDWKAYGAKVVDRLQ
jgi:predicted Zn-dependent peptidase